MFEVIEGVRKIARNQKVIKYELNKVKTIYGDEQVLKVFCEVGVPRQVSPMLNFILDEKGGFSKLNGYGNWSKGTELFGINKEEIVVLAHYNSNLIYIDKMKQIKMLDYENQDVRYVNKDVISFLESIICFNLFTMEIMNNNPHCDYIEDCITDDEIEELGKKLMSIDEDSMNEYSLWNEAVEQLIE